MAKANPMVYNFTAGELSPALWGRIDFDKYQNGCKLLENMITRPHGPAFKRPGTYFVTEIKGRNETVNGDFASDTSWTKEAGWSITGGKAVHVASGIGSIYQGDNYLLAGWSYEFTFTVSDWTAGEVKAYIGGEYGTPVTANGTYTEIIVAGSNDTQIAMVASANFDGKIDNVILLLLDPETRLMSFEFSVVQTYILQLTEKHIKFFTDHKYVGQGGGGESGNPYEVNTPYLKESLLQLQSTQSADTFYFAHSEYPPMKLMRYANNDWALEEIDFKKGPFLDENTTSTTVRTSGTSGSVTVTASQNIFVENHIGALWQICHNRDDTRLTGTFGSTGETATIFCTGGWEFRTHGTWAGQICIKRKLSKSSGWQKFRTYTSENDSNVSVTGREEEDGVSFKIEMEVFNAGACRYNFNAHDYVHKGVVKITAFTDAQHVTATVVTKSIGKTSNTKMWSEGAWSKENGFPACVEFFEDRLVWAGSKLEPQTLWSSQTSDYENMLAGVNDDDAYLYTIAARGVNPIRWLVATDVLIIGTKGAEWYLGTTETDAVVTPSNVTIRKQSTWGSRDIQAEIAGDATVFWQRAGTRLREFTSDPISINIRFVAIDLTLLSEHITEGGVTNMAVQSEPATIIWCIRADGALLGLTYERRQEVVSWHRHFTYSGDDRFRSIAIITSEDEDEVWFAVDRFIDGHWKKYAEYFKPWKWDKIEDVHYLDSGLRIASESQITITGATQANPCEITTNIDSLFLDTQIIRIIGVQGMTELNEGIYRVANKGTTTFTLTKINNEPIDSTGYGAYTSGGYARRVDQYYNQFKHLAGRTISLLGDGSVMPDCEVDSNGCFTAENYVSTIVGGLAYTSKLMPMNIEAGGQIGVAQGKIKKISRLKVRFQDTLACKVGSCEDDLEEIIFRTDADPMDESTPVFEVGDKEIFSFPGGFESDGDVLIQSDTPLPLTVVAIMPELETYDIL